MLCTAHYDSPLGDILLAADEIGLTGLWFAGQKYFGGTLGANLVPKDGLPVFLAAEDRLDRYFAGTSFQQAPQRGPRQTF